MPGQTHTFVTDSRYADDAARAAVRAAFSRRRLAGIGLLVLGCVLLNGKGIPGLVGLLLGAVVALVAVVLLVRARTRRVLTVAIPVGSRYEARLDDEGLWLATPFRWGHTAYRALERADVDGRCVVLRQRYGGGGSVLPREIFPDEMRTELNARIRAAAPVTVTAAPR